MKLTMKDSYYIEGSTVMKQEETLYTTTDIETLPENIHAELIDGRMYMMAPPTTTHQRILNFINITIYNYIKENHGECEVFIPPFGVYLNETDNFVEPDLTVICDKSNLDEKGFHGGPDLVVEIVSPSSARMDYVLKLFKYRTYGVHEYWIIDFSKNRIQVYNFIQENMQEYTFSDKIPLSIYNGNLIIDFSELNLT